MFENVWNFQDNKQQGQTQQNPEVDNNPFNEACFLRAKGSQGREALP